MSDNVLKGELQVSFNDSKATANLNKFSKNAVTQTANINKALEESKATVDELAAALKRAGGADIAQKLNKSLALTKEEYQKIRKALQDVVREQEKSAAAAERAAKKVSQKKEAAQGRADITTEAVKERKAFEENEKRITATHRAQLRERERAVKAYEATIQRSMKLSQDLQNKVTQAVSGTAAAQQRLNMISGGMTPHQALFQQLQPSMGHTASNWLAGGGRMPAGLPGAGGAGGGGFNWRQIAGTLGFGGGGGALGGVVGNLLGGLGIGAGAYGVSTIASGIKNSADAATAYDRMEVSARKLAGSQAELNKLLAAYEKAAGGAASEAVALENVLKLQATGFAKSAEQVERFVRGARGSSLALGKPQEFIVQETQLAISNTSFKRLDQIGLGIGEVTERIKKLRGENKGLTQEMAFQEAVIGLLNEKYGDLSDTIEGQASGSEKMVKAVSDLNLAFGQLMQGPMALFGAGVAVVLDGVQKRVEQITAAIEAMGNMLVLVTRMTPGMQGIGRSLMTTTEQEMWSRPGDRGERSRSIGTPWSKQSLDEDQTAAVLEWSIAKAQIEKRANAELLEEHRNYVRQYRSAQEDFQTTLLREEEDFNRSRERQAAESARQMAEVQEDAVRREEQAARDLSDAFAKLERDFTRQQAIMERDLTRSIANMQAERTQRLADAEEDQGLRIEDSRKDSLKRLTEMQTEYDERIAEEREDSNERLTEMQTEYDKERERAARSHNDSLAMAAMNLDAKGIWMENKRWEREQEEAEKEHQDELAKERKRLQDFETEANEEHQKAIGKEKERQAEFETESNAAFQRQLEREALQYARREEQERASHQQRVDDAKEALEVQRQDMIAADGKRREDAAKADADRLEDIQEAISLQQTAEDEDRRIRLERMESDHNKQLSEMTRVHNDRITQIGEHAQDERDKLNEEFQAEMTELGYHIDAYQLEHERLVQSAMDEFDEYIEHVNEELYKQRTGGQTKPPANNADAIKTQEGQRDYWDGVAREYARQGNFGPEYQDALNKRNAAIDEINRLKSLGGTANVAQAALSMGSSNSALQSNSTVMNGGATVVIAAGAIQISALPGQSPSVLGDEFEKRLLNIVKRLTRTQ